MYKTCVIIHKICSMNEKFKIIKPEMINKTFRFPADLLEEMQTLAQNKGISLNNLVVQCCEYALKNLDSQQ